MSEAADRRIADLEMHIKDLERRCENQVGIIDRDLARIKELEAKLVQRDVYEAEQRLPPEHAVLIKHLATVERCINEGPVTYHYAEESDCSFCGEWQGHTRDCAWLALQMDRGVKSVIDDIHAVALQEHERRERTIYARPAHRALSPEDLARAAQAVERSREQTIGNMRVYTNPNVAPGTVFVMRPSDFRGIPALRQGAGLESPIAMQMRLEAEAALRQEPAQLVQSDWHVLTPEERYEDSGGVAGSAPSAVAPPDDEDVP